MTTTMPTLADADQRADGHQGASERASLRRHVPGAVAVRADVPRLELGDGPGDGSGIDAERIRSLLTALAVDEHQARGLSALALGEHASLREGAGELGGGHLGALGQNAHDGAAVARFAVPVGSLDDVHRALFVGSVLGGKGLGHALALGARRVARVRVNGGDVGIVQRIASALADLAVDCDLADRHLAQIAGFGGSVFEGADLCGRDHLISPQSRDRQSITMTASYHGVIGVSRGDMKIFGTYILDSRARRAQKCGRQAGFIGLGALALVLIFVFVVLYWFKTLNVETIFAEERSPAFNLVPIYVNDVTQQQEPTLYGPTVSVRSDSEKDFLSDIPALLFKVLKSVGLACRQSDEARNALLVMRDGRQILARLREPEPGTNLNDSCNGVPLVCHDKCNPWGLLVDAAQCHMANYQPWPMRRYELSSRTENLNYEKRQLSNEDNRGDYANPEEILGPPGLRLLSLQIGFIVFFLVLAVLGCFWFFQRWFDFDVQRNEQWRLWCGGALFVGSILGFGTVYGWAWFGSPVAFWRMAFW